MAAATMIPVEDQEARDERYRMIRERVQERAEVLRAELHAAMGRVTTRLDGHQERLDAHDEEIGALKARVDAMADVHVRAHQAEGLPVPAALQPEPLLRLVADGG